MFGHDVLLSLTSRPQIHHFQQVMFTKVLQSCDPMQGYRRSCPSSLTEKERDRQHNIRCYFSCYVGIKDHHVKELMQK